MHELSVCQGLIGQLEGIGHEQGAQSIDRVVIQIGPLSGVVPQLLREAFSIARAGTVADQARLEIEELAVRVRCNSCGSESEVAPNKLVCSSCGDWQTQLIGGDELLLARVELSRQSEN